MYAADGDFRSAASRFRMPALAGMITRARRLFSPIGLTRRGRQIAVTLRQSKILGARRMGHAAEGGSGSGGHLTEVGGGSHRALTWAALDAARSRDKMPEIEVRDEVHKSDVSEWQ